MEGEVATHHPVVILGLGLQDVRHGPALVLAEIEDLHPFVHYEAAGEIDDDLFTGEFDDAFHGIAEVGIAYNLGFQDLHGRQGVDFGAVGSFERFFTVKLVGGAQGALFHHMEYFLHIYQLAALHVKIDFRPEELLHEHGNVETVGIIAPQVAGVEELLYFVGRLLKSRGILDHFVANSM